ncbi:XRE family transcriptional regulator [Microbacterium sp. HSID17254]|uniref:helix-turn-helix domain-containing protein n=1 Tax=Microbacterium sp. HSID17254 TaxID=2419509 RepID=UPI000F87DCF5|nr:helix-turn-helix domain-containing protein [Microbacterium sp. HSID17254]RUQ07045.1 XRE family transcriptional regulator [Microbacterium sp. HSID17254]
MSVSIRLKPGLVDRLRETRNLNSEEAVARLVGSDRTTLRRIIRGAQPSGAFIASFCDAFGLGLGEAFEIVRDIPVSQAPVTGAAA